MNTSTSGKQAEELVAQYLKKNDHKVLFKNWKNRWCEIDIISRHKKVVYFTEVKYRASSDWGDGLSYITKIKLNQMKFAAEFWIAENNWSGEVQLLGAGVDRNFNVKLVEISA